MLEFEGTQCLNSALWSKYTTTIINRMNKTQKRSVSPTSFTQNDTDTLNTFLDNEKEQAYANPWHRLDKALRLNRLRDFAEKEAVRLNLPEGDLKNLNVVLQKGLAKGQLSSKATVSYDSQKQEITEIKALVMHRNSSGNMLFQIVEKKSGVTFRKPKQSSEPKQNSEAKATEAKAVTKATDAQK